MSDAMNRAYEAPAIEVLGQLGAVTLKNLGLGDGLLFKGTSDGDPGTGGSA